VTELTEDDRAALSELRAAVMRLARRLRNQRVDESLSSTEMAVLGTLARCGSATPGELARKEHVQPPSMTRIVAMLEAKRLVRREPHPDDRRQVVVTRTEQAEAILARAKTLKRGTEVPRIDRWASLTLLLAFNKLLNPTEFGNPKSW